MEASLRSGGRRPRGRDCGNPPRRTAYPPAPHSRESNRAPPLGPGGTKRRSSSWLILDRFIHRSERDAEARRDGTASEISHTCTGKPIRASLRVADPPAVSRLYLHWACPEFGGWLQRPVVIAAHGHSILFETVVPLKDCPDDYMFPMDFFVYSAFSSPPSLHRLPACFIGGISTPDEDIYFKPYRRRQQRIMPTEEMGLLCHGDNGDFTVVDFTGISMEAELCLLHHHAPPGSGVETQWRIKKVRLPEGPSFHSWFSDAILPVDGRFLCSADNYQGILVVDVLLANNESCSDDLQLRYIPIPKELSNRRRYPDGDCPDPDRCVCVTQTGIIKLVCITSQSHSAFAIRSWTLYNIYEGEWHKDVTMWANEFWGLYDSQSLPQVKPQPEYPLVNFVHPDIVSFLLEEGQSTYWIIEVDMRNKVLKSSAIYINEEEEGCIADWAGVMRNRVLKSSAVYINEEEEECIANWAGGNTFDGDSFIPSQLSAFLGKDAIISRELSGMMQMAKKRKAVGPKKAEVAQLQEQLKVCGLTGTIAGATESVWIDNRRSALPLE